MRVGPAITLSLIVAVEAMTQSQGVPGPPSRVRWWFNAHSSPLVFGYEARPCSTCKRRRQDSSWLTIRNRSQKVVDRFYIGCVVSERGRVRVASWAGTASGDLRPEEFTVAFLDTSNLANEDFGKRRCLEIEKVTVTEVYFADGTIWKIHGLAWEEIQKP
jgi:hypothetical protein